MLRMLDPSTLIKDNSAQRQSLIPFVCRNEGKLSIPNCRNTGVFYLIGVVEVSGYCTTGQGVPHHDMDRLQLKKDLKWGTVLW